MGLKHQIEKAHNNLSETQQNLLADKMNKNLIMQEKRENDQLLTFIENEEQIMRLRAKINWIRLGDGNNSYFHTTLKSKQKHKMITRLFKKDGTMIVS